MDNKTNQKLDNTIKIVYDILEKNKDNPEAQQAYIDIKKLAQKRNKLNAINN
jgi:hypothetical protein